jgi:hypothetical protein
MVLARRQNSPVDVEIAPTARPTDATTAEAQTRQ